MTERSTTLTVVGLAGIGLIHLLDSVDNLERAIRSATDANSDGVPDTVSTATRTQAFTLDAVGNPTTVTTNPAKHEPAFTSPLTSPHAQRAGAPA